LTQGATRRTQIDLQPLVVPYLGNRYSRAFPFGGKADEVPHGFHRVFHEVDRGRTSGPDYGPQDSALRMEEHSVSLRSIETVGV